MKELSEKDLGKCDLCRENIEFKQSLFKSKKAVWQLLTLKCKCIGVDKEKVLKHPWEGDTIMKENLEFHKEDFLYRFIINRIAGDL